MNTSKFPAAYQGEGWQARQGSLKQEIAAGRFWSNHFVNSDWNFLRAVVLYFPDPSTPTVDDVNAIQHLEQINYSLLHKQMNKLSDCYKQLGINVFPIKSGNYLSKGFEKQDLNNLIFVRDLFFMTPEGAILARMGSMVRAGEEKHAARTLAELGVPILRTISGTGTFEGADALWICSNLVLIGVGNRTNEAGYHQVKSCLELQGTECVKVPLPLHIQHLMGILQFVDRDLAIVRGQLLSSGFVEFLRGFGMHVVSLDETASITRGLAMNFVTVAPRKIVMAAGNPGTKSLLEDNGIEVVEELEVSELIKGAGGIGCTTGILHRDLIEL